MGYYWNDWFSLSSASSEAFAYRLEWGPNRYAANTALLAAVWAKYRGSEDVQHICHIIIRIYHIIIT